MARCLLALLALCPGAALAQPVFLDDFDGNALLPHWIRPPPSYWAYNVSNSTLNVTGLFYPSSPEGGLNTMAIEARFTPQSDFRMDVWMGWEAVQYAQGLQIWVGGPFSPNNPVLASFAYRYYAPSGPNPVVIAGASNQAVSMPAPAPGIHQFTVSRTGSRYNFELDGTSFASFPDIYGGIPAGAVVLAFGGPYPGQLVPLHVDRIQVIPAPGTAGILLLVFAMAGGRHMTVEALHV